MNKKFLVIIGLAQLAFFYKHVKMLGFLTLSINNLKPNSGKMSVDENTDLFTGLKNGEFKAIITTQSGVYLLSEYQGESTKAEAGQWSLHCPDFEDLDSARWQIFTRSEKIGVNSSNSLSKVNWSEPSFQAFAKIFNQLQTAFKKSPLRKAVPIVYSRAKLSLKKEEILNSVVSQLKHKKEYTYSYGIWSDDGGILGRTPELLFEYDGNRLQTMALAGTAAADRDDHEFLNDPKELREHQLVCEDIVERLGGFGDITTSEINIKKLSKIKHLRSFIELVPDSSLDYSEIVRALHPTPALGVSPRSELNHWITRLSVNENRRRYGAPFGWIDPKGNMTCLVAIRNIQWSGENILLGSGCGIVSQSVLEREWNELCLKREQVKEDLGL